MVLSYHLGLNLNSHHSPAPAASSPGTSIDPPIPPQIPSPHSPKHPHRLLISLHPQLQADGPEIVQLSRNGDTHPIPLPRETALQLDLHPSMCTPFPVPERCLLALFPAAVQSPQAAFGEQHFK